MQGMHLTCNGNSYFVFLLGRILLFATFRSCCKLFVCFVVMLTSCFLAFFFNASRTSLRIRHFVVHQPSIVLNIFFCVKNLLHYCSMHQDYRPGNADPSPAYVHYIIRNLGGPSSGPWDSRSSSGLLEDNIRKGKECTNGRKDTELQPLSANAPFLIWHPHVTGCFR